MDFRKLDNQEVQDLMKALRGNSGQFGESGTILMDRRDTSFVGYSQLEPDDGEKIINAIRSVPCHY